MTETTATLLVGTSREWFAGRRFDATHLLVLSEGSRPVWRLVPLGAARPGAPRSGTRSMVGRPESPEHLIAHALLMFMAAAAPDVLRAEPSLAALVTVEERGLSVRTSVPDDAIALRVYGAFPDGAGAVLMTLPGSSVHPLDAAGLVGAGKHVTVAAAEPVSAPLC